MRQCLFVLLGIVFIFGIIPGCEKKDEISGPDGIDGTPDVPSDLVLSRTFPPLLANGFDEVTVRATVVDGRGKGLADVGVLFSTTRGTIEPFATTGSDGIAETILTSVASTEDTIYATVTAEASSGSEADTEEVAVAQDAIVLVSSRPLSREAITEALATHGGGRPTGAVPLADDDIEDQVEVMMIGVTLTVEANPSTIPADGISQSRIEATLIETGARIPLEGETIRFGATGGTITGDVETDAAGSAVAILTADPAETSAEVTAFYGGRDLWATTIVGFSPLTLDLAAGSSILVADGTSTTEVVARLINQQRNPVPGARIDFATTLGTITSPIDTDVGGEAVATLVTSTTQGMATITARFGALGEVAIVEFIAAPNTADIVLSVDPAFLPADGASQATVTATALDSNNNPMPDGAAVTFSIVSGGGEIIGPVGLTVDGVAQAVYVAGGTAGAVTIRATSGSAQEDVPLILVPSDAGGIDLTANPPSILADGIAMSRISAIVRDRFGNAVSPGTAVGFTTTNGLIEDVQPTDDLGIARWERSRRSSMSRLSRKGPLISRRWRPILPASVCSAPAITRPHRSPSRSRTETGFRWIRPMRFFLASASFPTETRRMRRCTRRRRSPMNGDSR
jgi:hypothetical protein